ncbi:MAG: hypothetical protein KAR20_00150, partial [Candidatus Heimdallarchaeota archaeon]|nr:hypothetical protein [Candidatus Heimdallarchaeota archaeon]
TLDRPTFRDRYLNHIPPKGTVTIRNYGLYSNRYSDLLKEIKENILKAESAEPEPDLSFEEECRECHETLITKETFSCSDYPLILRLHLLKNNDPPGHGYSFKTA